MINKKSRNAERQRRHDRVRKRVFGTSECPRLNVFRSLRHIYAQIIDDSEGKVLVAANSLQKEVAAQANDDMSGKDIANLVGKVVAERAKNAGIESIVFDRAGYKYHGRIAALADGAREGGLNF